MNNMKSYELQKREETQNLTFNQGNQNIFNRLSSKQTDDIEEAESPKFLYPGKGNSSVNKMNNQMVNQRQTFMPSQFQPRRPGPNINSVSNNNTQIFKNQQSLNKYKNLLQKIQKEISHQQVLDESMQLTSAQQSTNQRPSTRSKSPSTSKRNHNAPDSLADSGLSFDNELKRKLKDLEDQKKQVISRSGDQQLNSITQQVLENSSPLQNVKNYELNSQSIGGLEQQQSQPQAQFSFNTGYEQNNTNHAFKYQPSIVNAGSKSNSGNKNNRKQPEIGGTQWNQENELRGFQNNIQKTNASVNNSAMYSFQITNSAAPLDNNNSLINHSQNLTMTNQTNNAFGRSGASSVFSKDQLDYSELNEKWESKLQEYMRDFEGDIDPLSRTNRRLEFIESSRSQMMLMGGGLGNFKQDRSGDQKMNVKASSSPEKSSNLHLIKQNNEIQASNENIEEMRSSQQDQVSSHKITSLKSNYGRNNNLGDQSKMEQGSTAEVDRWRTQRSVSNGGKINYDELQKNDLSNSSDEKNNTSSFGHDITPLEIISNQEVQNFLKSYFSENNRKIVNQIRFKFFFQALLEEYQKEVSELDDSVAEELLAYLRGQLTTSNENFLSFNALQIFTKERGLLVPFLNSLNQVKSLVQKRITQKLNETIIEQLVQARDMLQRKKVELIEHEKRLKEWQQQLNNKEVNFKEILRGQYDVLIYNLQEVCKQKLISVNKKSQEFERNMKNQMKILETRAKDAQVKIDTHSVSEDKLKARIAAVEKQNQFLKVKASDLEKKLAQEQQLNESSQETAQKLSLRLRNLEQTMKDLHEANETLKQNSHHFLSPNADLKRKLNQLDDQEDFNSEQDLARQKNQILFGEFSDQQLTFPSPIKPNFEENFHQMSDVSVSELKEVVSIKANSENHPLPPQSATSQIQKGSVKDQQPPATSSSTALKKQSVDDEGQLIIKLLDHIITSLKQILPVYISMGSSCYNNNNNNSMLNSSSLMNNSGINKSALDQMISDQQNFPIDIGEIFYPSYNNLVSYLVEICPGILEKPYNPKEVYSIIELLFQIVFFQFRYKVNKSSSKKIRTILPDEYLENSQNLVKSPQDHINQVMIGSSSSQTQITFVPSSSFWKKKIKVVPSVPLSQARSTSNSLGNTQKTSNSSSKQGTVNEHQHTGPAYALFSNTEVQRELLGIFHNYVVHSDIMVKRKLMQNASSMMNDSTNNNNQNNNTGGSVVMTFDFSNQANSNQKVSVQMQRFVLMTRSLIHQLILILSISYRESFVSLKNILLDISNDNEAINEFVKQFLIENGLTEIIVWRMNEFQNEITVITSGVDLLLHLNSNGAHYRRFIQEVSEVGIINTLIDVFSLYSNNNEICEQLSVILQRISYHNPSLKDRISQKQMSIFKTQLIQADKADDQFLSSNLQSILNNLSFK